VKLPSEALNVHNTTIVAALFLCLGNFMSLAFTGHLVVDIGTH
jgi:hypothetical protein